MEMRPWLSWPVHGQLMGPDALARSVAVTSPITPGLRPRVTAYRVVDSVCPFCAGGCRQHVYAGVASAQDPCYVVALQRVRPDPAVPDYEGHRR